MGRFILILLIGAGTGGALCGQPTSPAPGALRGSAGQPPMPAAASRTPVDFFRELLAMSAADREKNLAGRSNQVRLFVEGRLKEFEALSPREREARLQTLQLRWLLPPLMRTPPERRGLRLDSLRETDRRLVESRLEEWDRLPEDLQKKILDNENVVRVFFRSETNSPQVDLSPVPTQQTPAQREKLEKDWMRWNALPKEDQEKILAQAERWFKLSAAEQERIIRFMDLAERRKMEITLKQFARLPKEQRETCLRGFQKFAALTPEERQEFLSNAERWQTMSAEDRQIWRDLVKRLQPSPPLPRRAPPRPLPPGAVPQTSPPPPSTSPSGVATN